MARVAIVGAERSGWTRRSPRAAGHDPVVFEAASSAAAHVRAWGHVRLFTPWSWNVSPRMAELLGPGAPGDEELPTGYELADRILDPVAAALGARTGVRVLGNGR